jgi:hypothetical protein
MDGMIGAGRDRTYGAHDNMYCHHLLVIWLGCCAVACGSSNPSTQNNHPDAEATGEAGEASTGGPEGGPTDATPGDVAQMPEAALPYSGEVLLESVNHGDADAQEGTALVAHFFGSSDAVLLLDCPGALKSGACCYVPPPAADAGAPVGVSAGTISVASMGSTVATMTFGAGTYSTNDVEMPPWWAPGGMISVTAPGDTIQAFSATVTAPAAVTGLSPDPGPETSTVSISVSSAWSIGWTPSSSSGTRVFVELINNTQGSEIKCIEGDAVGTVSVSPTLLKQFAAGSGGGLVISRAVLNTASCANANVLVAPISNLDWAAKFTP